MPEHNKPDKITTSYLIGFAFQLGYSIAIPLVVFIGGGVWLDTVLHTKPVLLFVGIILGFISSGYFFYQILRPFIKK